MKKILSLLLMIFILKFHLLAQSVSINNNAAAPNPSSMLDVQSNSKGLLIPRMATVERTGITSPAIGLLVYDNETGSFWFYKSTGWTELIAGTVAGTNFWSPNGNNIFKNNTGNVGIGTNTPAAPLHIKNDNEALRIQGTTSYLSFNDNAATLKGFIQSYNNDLYMGTPSTNTTGNLQFYVANTPALTIKPSADVIIGSDASNTFGKFTVQTLNNSYGISHLGEGGNILATRMGGTSAGIGTFSNTNMRIFANGASAIFIGSGTNNVGIGKDFPAYKLEVNGTIHSKEVIVDMIGWPDYVFEKKYTLLSLNDVEKFIDQNKHLPNMPSAKEVEENGLHVGDLQKKMMEKIEELTVYIIRQQKEIDALKKSVSEKN